MKAVVDALLHADHGCIKSMDEIEAVGHRAVHGGQYFSQSVILTDEVYEILDKKCRDLAPLHTPASLQGIQACVDILPNTPQALVFDTAFHQTMPEEAYMYGVSYDLYEDYGIRRYGMHGTSHRYVAGEMIKILGGNAEGTKIVTCHLGNGSSISAVKDGKCIDTTMGFTPLAGTIMGTRCGDIDPALVTYIMEKKGYSIDEVNNYLNKKCGFLGVSGVSSDCRDLEAAIAEGNHRAQLAIDILKYQIKKYIGSYAAAMGGLDAVVFTAGIGENTPKIRAGALSGLEFLGIELNQEVNAGTMGFSGVTQLSTDS
jgi:acetate kinase